MRGRTLGLVVLACTVASCGPKPRTHPSASTTVPTRGVAAKIVEGARLQLVNPAFYDNRYASIGYPLGDVGPERGVCTDVVIRSLRHAGYDLQKLIHEDMRRHFSKYPRREAQPDSNIDHRRVPNIAFFFKGHGVSLPVDRQWKPGDFVVWKMPSGRDHIGVVDDHLSPEGIPLVIHNAGTVTEDDCLQAWTIVGHYRYPIP